MGMARVGPATLWSFKALCKWLADGGGACLPTPSDLFVNEISLLY